VTNTACIAQSRLPWIGEIFAGCSVDGIDFILAQQSGYGFIVADVSSDVGNGDSHGIAPSD
jgi:hypothetical protein